MSILETILKAGGGDLVKKVAGNVGMEAGDTSKALAAVMPYLKSAMQDNVKSEDGLSSFVKALTSGGHGKYIDNPDEIVNENGQTDGMAILGHLFGSKDQGQAKVAELSEKLDFDTGTLTKLIPMAATMLMGSMSKNSDALNLNSASSGTSFLQSGVISFLDKDKDGSVVDDLLGSIASKFLR